MKSVLISIKPQWCEKIASGEKTIEVRKSAPKEVPFKAYIYCTRITDKKHCSDELDIGRWKGNEHVIGEFICDKVEVLFNTNGNPENYMTDILPTVLQKTALSFKEFQNYVGSRSDKNNIYGWHISDLKIYDEPKELSEFTSPRVCGNYKDLPAYIHVGCNMCKYSYTINCMIKCRIDGREPLTRPPQSYMYVEEI